MNFNSKFFKAGMDDFGNDGSTRIRRPNIDTTKLYETLGVSKDADKKEIKKAYMKLARTHHPDKGGDEHKFKEINAANEILSDPVKRAKYDKYGLEGIANEGDAGTNVDDIFSTFFPGARQRKSSGPQKGANVNYPIKVTLEQLYNGKTKKMAINRSVQVGEPTMCDECNGMGYVIKVQQLGPGMVQQIQKICSGCNGDGYFGETKNERTIVEVHIEKGMKNKEKIIFHGMADEKPNMEPGDINFIVEEEEHKIFKRKGADLLIKKTLSLNEALCGFEWSVRHLDNREIIIKSRPGEVISPENAGRGIPFVKAVSNEGMPSKGNPFVRGDLYVLFTVQFPKDGELDPATVEILKNILPNPKMDIDYEEENIELRHLDVADVKNFGRGGAAIYDDSDDSDENVGCRQS